MLPPRLFMVLVPQTGMIVIESKVPKEGRLWVTTGEIFCVEIPDLSDYNLMNAEEKLRAEVLAGMYEGNGSIEVLQNYQDKLREVKRGVDTYWLDKPLRTSVQQRHTVTLEGGGPGHCVIVCMLGITIHRV